MNIVEIAQAVAKDVGLAVPDVVVSSGLRETVELLEMANATGRELARRVDWGALNNFQTLTGDGTERSFDLGNLFSRITSGIGVRNAEGGIVRPLTRGEWLNLTHVEGVPRYFFLEGSQISFWPYLAVGATATVATQTKAWCSNGDESFTADTDETLLDDDLFIKGLIVRWRRQKGLDYSDYEAEYEAALRDYARFDDRSRL